MVYLHSYTYSCTYTYIFLILCMISLEKETCHIIFFCNFWAVAKKKRGDASILLAHNYRRSDFIVSCPVIWKNEPFLCICIPKFNFELHALISRELFYIFLTTSKLINWHSASCIPFHFIINSLKFNMKLLFSSQGIWNVCDFGLNSGPLLESFAGRLRGISSDRRS